LVVCSFTFSSSFFLGIKAEFPAFFLADELGGFTSVVFLEAAACPFEMGLLAFFSTVVVEFFCLAGYLTI